MPAAAGVALTLLLRDMRALETHSEFPIVLCLADSICYMQNLEAVQQVLLQVASCLPTGGDFLLAAHSLYQMDQVFPGYKPNYQTEAFAFLWNSFIGAHPHSIAQALTFFKPAVPLDAYCP